jgi:hypothetical protein
VNSGVSTAEKSVLPHARNRGSQALSRLESCFSLASVCGGRRLVSYMEACRITEQLIINHLQWFKLTTVGLLASDYGLFIYYVMTG